MFNTDDLVSGVLSGVMGGGRKRSRKALRYLTGQGSGGIFSNPQTLLTVAGLAWGIFDTMQNQSPGQGQWGGGGSGAGLGSVPQNPPAPGTPAAAMPPLPNIPGAPNVPPDVIRVVRLSIAAAAADGTLSDDDKARILQRAREGGVEDIVEQELQHRRPLTEIVGGVTDPAQRATLYVLAFGIVRADESVSGAERIFLAQLANQLGLDPATISKLEADAAARIDAQT